MNVLLSLKRPYMVAAAATLTIVRRGMARYGMARFDTDQHITARLGLKTAKKIFLYLLKVSKRDLELKLIKKPPPPDHHRYQSFTLFHFKFNTVPSLD